MKRVRAWDKLSQPAYLWEAWRAFARGKRRRPDVAEFSVDADRHVVDIARAIREGTWRPAGYRTLRITDPKRRLIAAAPVRDRIVHTALHRALAPRLDRRFIEHSYACIAGRGSHRALLTFQGRMQRSRWVLQLDVRRYFYQVQHARLRALLVRHLPEPEIQRLVDVVLASGRGLYSKRKVAEWLGWDAPQAPDLGLPIGNLTSQWWGNHYLDGLDHFVQRELRPAGYQRYMDDFTLFGDDRDQLLVARERIATWLSEHRGLTLKDPERVPEACRGRVGYLGHRVSPHGIWPGRKAIGRIPAHVARAVGSVRRLRAVVGSIGAMWMVGDRRAPPRPAG